MRSPRVALSRRTRPTRGFQAGDYTVSVPTNDVMPEPPATASGVFTATYRWVTVGMCLLVILDAFESLAVTTMMPVVTRELHGGDLYSFVFAVPIAVGLVGMVAAGISSDRGNPRVVLLIAVAVFMAGTLLAGLAPTMSLFIIGRLIHGLAGGALAVVLYVIVARLYLPELHPRIFAAFAAAWVVPSLVGPFVSGILAQTVGWRWAFIGVFVLTCAAMALVLPAVRAVRRSEVPVTPLATALWSLLWASALALAILALSAATESHGPWRWVIIVVAIIGAVVAARPLLPRGTVSGRPGLPSVILVRASTAGAFSAAEVYVPLMLVTLYRQEPAEAGLALTFAGLTWAGASWVQGRFPAIRDRHTAVLGAAGLTIALLSLIICSMTAVTPIVAVVGWIFAGAGMGIVSPRLGTATLGQSEPDNQGFNSSALNIAYSAAAAIALALVALAASFFGARSSGGFVAIFVTAALLCLPTFFLASRMEKHP